MTNTREINSAVNLVNRRTNALLLASEHAERLLLSAVWSGPAAGVGGVAGAERAGLSSAAFALDVHREMWTYLRDCAGNNRRPRFETVTEKYAKAKLGPTAEEIRILVASNIREVGRDFASIPVDKGTPRERWSMICESYAQRVMDLAERRTEASKCMQRFMELTDIDPAADSEAPIEVTEQIKLKLPMRRRRRRYA
jgi:hypothetical protein